MPNPKLIMNNHKTTPRPQALSVVPTLVAVFGRAFQLRVWLAIFVAFLTLLGAGQALAAVTWTSTSSTAWSTSGNWSAGGPPTTSLGAIFASKTGLVNPLANANPNNCLQIQFTAAGWDIGGASPNRIKLWDATTMINCAGNNTISCNSISISGGASSVINVSSGALTLSCQIGDASTSTPFKVTGAGKVIISNTGNNWSQDGRTIIDSGASLQLGASGVIPDGSAVTVNGTLLLAGFVETIGSVAGSGVISSGGGSASLTSGGDNTSTTFSGSCNSSGTSWDFIKNGTGTLTLSGTALNTDLQLYVNAGTVILNKTTTAGAYAVDRDASVAGGVLQLSGNTGDQINNGHSVTITSGAFDMAGKNETVSGVNVAGTGISSGGALINSTGSSTLTGGVTMTADSSMGGAGNLTLASAVGGAFALTKVGAGNLTLNGTVASTSVTVSLGTLTLGAANRLADGATLNRTGGTIALGNFTDTINAFQVSGTTKAKGTWGSTASSANHKNSTYFGTTGTGILTVTTGGTSSISTPSSTANPSTYGSAATVSVTVTGASGDASAPSGTVTFYDGGVSIGTASLGSPSGVTATASLALSATLSAGTHSITASYGGNDSYDVSPTSATLSQVVNPKALGITAPTVTKVYDGGTTAGTVTVGTLSGFVSPETVTATGAATVYSSKNVGSSYSSTVSYTLANGANGGLAANYSLANSVIGNAAITTRALTITAAANSKTYDGNPTSMTNATLSSGVIQGSDTAPTWTQAYSSKNVGTSLTLTPASLKVTDSNSGDNYSYTYMPASTGVISQTNIEVTAVTDTKTYDGGVASAGLPTLTSGTIQPGDSEPTWMQTFDTKHVGAGKTLTPAGLVNDSNGGANYSYTYTPVSTGEVTQTNSQQPSGWARSAMGSAAISASVMRG